MVFFLDYYQPGPDTIAPYLIKSNEQGTPGSAKGSFSITTKTAGQTYPFFVWPSAYATAGLSYIYRNGSMNCDWGYARTGSVLLAGVLVAITYRQSSVRFSETAPAQFTWTAY